MKKITVLLLFILAAITAPAQTFFVQQTVAYAAGDSDLTDFNTVIKVFNTAPGNTTLRWVRTQQLMPPTWRTSVCNASYCFPMSTDSAVFTMTPGDSDEVDMRFYPFNTNGSAQITVKLYDINDPSNGVILTFHGNTTVSVKEYSAIEFMLFPNPASKELFVKANENILFIEVVNALGQAVRHAEISQGQNDPVLSLSGVPAGCYFVRVKNGEGRVGVKRIVVI